VGLEGLELNFSRLGNLRIGEDFLDVAGEDVADNVLVNAVVLFVGKTEDEFQVGDIDEFVV